MKRTVNPGVVIEHACLGGLEHHGSAAQVHNLDPERQIVIGKSSGAMAPRFHFDGDGRIIQPCRDGVLSLIGLRGLVGQGPKPSSSAGLNQQQWDQERSSGHHARRLSYRF